MHAIANHVTCLPQPEISHRHARGLRRDLFRNFAGHASSNVRLLRQLQIATAPNIHQQERTKILRNLIRKARPALQFVDHSGSQTGTRLSGFILEPTSRFLPDGEIEEALGIIQVNLSAGPRLQVNSEVVGFVYPHAVERIFMRAGTTRPADALAELAAALPWLARLHAAARDCGRRIHQLPVPGSGGAFLARSCAVTGLIALHTWVRRNTNPRIDNTLAGIRAWHGTPTQDTASTFRALLADNRNRWLVQPYRSDSFI